MIPRCHLVATVAVGVRYDQARRQGIGRRDLIALLAATAMAPAGAAAQPQASPRRIGILETVPGSGAADAGMIFRRVMDEHGWVEGRSLLVDERSVGSDPARLEASAKELVALHSDLILTLGSNALSAAMRETRRIPIVFVQVVDPLAQGFVSSLSHPGGNVTGFSSYEFSMGGKWLELLKEIAPDVARVALVLNPTNPNATMFLHSVEAAAPRFGIAVIPARVRDTVELTAAIRAIAAEPHGALCVPPDNLAINNRAMIFALAAEYRLPAIYPFRFFARDGGLITYGTNTDDPWHGAAAYADRILKGESPGDLPVQAPTKFQLVINLKTAKALGLAIPPTLLARADEVIE